MRVRIIIRLVLLIVASFVEVRAQKGDARLTSNEIGRGVCGNRQYNHVSICLLPFTTPNMTVQVLVVRQFSAVPCISGRSYGLVSDNYYLWTSGGCQAEFSFLSLLPSSAPTVRPSVTTLRPTTASSTNTITTSITSPVSNSANCGEVGRSLHTRIIGGSEAGNCQFPWMVRVYNKVVFTACGGTIIDNTHILTAAHCIVDENKSTGVIRYATPDELLVLSGSSSIPSVIPRGSDLKIRSVREITRHESYLHSTLANDIAILTLDEPITFDACHKPVCLVDGRKTPQQATDCRVMGWGLTINNENADSPENMKFVDISVASDRACTNLYSPSAPETTFCAGSNQKGHCLGDSGGPFVCKEADDRYYVYGVVSAVIKNNCGNNYGLYTRVSAFLSWITSKTR